MPRRRPTKDQLKTLQDRAREERQRTGRPWHWMDGPRDRPPAPNRTRPVPTDAYRDGWERIWGSH